MGKQHLPTPQPETKKDYPGTSYLLLQALSKAGAPDKLNIRILPSILEFEPSLKNDPTFFSTDVGYEECQEMPNR